MAETIAKLLLALVPLATVFHLARRRLQLSLAKNRSLEGHSRMAKRAARLLPGYYTERRDFSRPTGPELRWRPAAERAFIGS
jgi:glutamate-1-semialdehyde 2,1-aminomutase